MTIREASLRCDISPETLRYYEQISMIPPIKRNIKGIRDYTEEDCKWIAFIKAMRIAGVSTEDLSGYLKMCALGDEAIIKRRIFLIEQYSSIMGRIEKLWEISKIIDEQLNYHKNQTI